MPFRLLSAALPLSLALLPWASRSAPAATLRWAASEALVRYNENLKIKPALATSWELIEPTVWRFHLLLVQVVHSKARANGLFHRGGWGMPQNDRLTDDADGELVTSKRLDMESRALEIAGENVLFIPLHQQPMPWATRSDVTQVVQLPDSKAGHWLTRMDGK